MTSKTTNKFSSEVRARAVRMVLEHEGNHASRLATPLTQIPVANRYGSANQGVHPLVQSRLRPTSGSVCWLRYRGRGAVLRGAVRRGVAVSAASLFLVTATVRAEAAGRPYMMQAQAAFDDLPARDRNEIFLELMATGDFNAMASSEFNGRLYDATASFQAKHGLEPSGVLTPETRQALSLVGGRVFNSWGFEFLDHPFAPASVVIPGHFGLARSPTQHGFALENRNHTMSADFSFFADNEATLSIAFDKLTRTTSGRRVDMKVIRPTFLAVASGTDKTSSYSRFIVVKGGIAGFTLSWNNDAFPSGVRVAVVMANELYPRHMVSDTGQQADIFEGLPSDASPSDTAPPDSMAFSSSTPTNAGADAVSQAVLQTKQEAQRRAAQEQADRQAAYAEQQRVAQHEAADRRTAADAAARADAAERIRVAQQEEAVRQAKAEANRLVQQAEADRKARAEQEARAAAAAQLKAERLARAVSVAKQAIEDASGFVKSSRDDPQLMDHLGRIADLNAALSATDPEVVEGKTSALSTAVSADPAYAAYGAQRSAERQRETARYLGDAVRTLKNQRSFLVGTVAQDPTSPQAARFLSLAKQAEAVLAAPDLDHAQTAMGTIEATIKDAGLRDAYAAASAAAKQVAVAEAVIAQPAASSTASTTPPPSQPAFQSSASALPSQSPAASLPMTEKDRFLLDGGRDDVVLMVNASPKAPHVYRDLKGDLVFDRDQADVCLFGRGADADLPSVVRSALAPYKLKQMSLPQTPCDGDRLDSYDVVATRRGQFLRQNMTVALQLVGSLEAGTLKQLSILTPAALQTAQATEAVAAEAVAEDVARGMRPGFGFLVVADEVSGLCAVTPQDAEAHQRLIARHADVLTAAMGAEPIAAPTTADGAFVSAKRGRCGAVYASAADLKTVADGLQRDGTKHRFLSLWFTPAEIQSSSDAIKAEPAAAEKQMAERQRKQAEDAKIGAMRAADETATLAARQAASRKQYGATATAAAARIAAEVNGFTDSPEDQTQVAVHKFPNFAALFRDDLGDRWEKMSENSELADYGVADWKGRSLETVFSRLNIRLKNRILGDYKDRCYVFGQINDTEFDATREHIVLPCDDEADLAAWQTEHGFKSFWSLR